MDAYSNKRGVGVISASKTRSVAASKDISGSRDGTGSAQFCNRLGCCGRLNPNTKSTKNKCLEKPKPLKPSFRSSSGKELTASSSKICSLNVKKSLVESEKKTFSKIETVQIESNSSPNESEIQELKGSRNRTNLNMKSKTRNLVSDQNSESNNGRRKRFTQGESSSSGKGKKIIGVSPNEEHVSVYDSRNLGNLTSCKTNGVSSIRTRKSLNLEASTGSISQRSSNVKSDMPQTQELNHNGGRCSSDTSSSMISVNSTDRPIARFVNDSGRRHCNIDGIADVLLALDRIEQDEELTYEQLVSLEANIFFGSLNFYDQHRDMRLDIDNMSYEELLVLEEKMGTVNTTLSEEELSKCIKTSIYESLQLEDGKKRRSSSADDSKCSICQEEFVRGDQIGSLGCGHGYHTSCINQWLHLKNWCPICKTSPESSSSNA